MPNLKSTKAPNRFFQACEKLRKGDELSFILPFITSFEWKLSDRVTAINCFEEKNGVCSQQHSAYCQKEAALLKTL